MSRLVTLKLEIPNNIDSNIEACKSFLTSLTTQIDNSSFKNFFGINTSTISLEIANVDECTSPLITCDLNSESFITSQLKSFYPNTIVSKIDDPIQNKDLYIQSFKLKNNSYYPILTYDKFLTTSPLQKIKGVISRTLNNDISFLQLSLLPTEPSWQVKGLSFADFGNKSSSDIYPVSKDRNLITEKVSYPSFYLSLRVASSTKETLIQTTEILKELSKENSNELIKDTSLKLNERNDLLKRKVNKKDVLNINEILSLWSL